MRLKAFFLNRKKMTTKRIVYDRLDINVAAGSLGASAHIDLTRGRCKGIRFISYDNATPAQRDHSINIDIKTNNADKILGPTDYRDFIHNGGGYIEGFKPCDFDTKAQVRVDIIPSEAVKAVNFKGQLVFAIEENTAQTY